MVDILMATYNGGKYIENQILSLIGQTYKDWTLYVHDDGSTDNTLQIVNKYTSIDSRIILINDGVVFGNAAHNFLHLLAYAKSDYIMFCDQDDIWFENKIKEMVVAIGNQNPPFAVYCNAYSFDNSIITSNEVTTIHRKNLQDSLFLNSGVQGCSVIFSKGLLNFIERKPDYVCMHDHLITLAAVTFGSFDRVDKSLMLYRQHADNVTGNIETSLLKRVYNFFFKGTAVLDYKHFKAVQSFYDAYEQEIPEARKKYFLAYFQFVRSGLFTRVKIIITFNFKIGSNILILLIKTLLRNPLSKSTI